VRVTSPVHAHNGRNRSVYVATLWRRAVLAHCGDFDGPGTLALRRLVPRRRVVWPA